MFSFNYTVLPRLTSDPANKDFFAVFRTRLTYVLVVARPNVKQQSWTVDSFQELVSANEDFS